MSTKFYYMAMQVMAIRKENNDGLYFLFSGHPNMWTINDKCITKKVEYWLKGPSNVY